MHRLKVSVEINGEQVDVGTIKGEGSDTACFTYDERYIYEGYPGISLSLPVSMKSFDSIKTKNFFDGLLPEGFVRKTVSEWVHVPENDYLEILKALGVECLGAIQVRDYDYEVINGYEKLDMSEVHRLAREGVTKSTEMVTEAHLSLTGASGKVGLYYNEDDGSWYLPKGDAPSTHIVKQSHVRYSNMVMNEQLSLCTAAELGIEIPESFIINTGKARDEDILFATKRYDRLIRKDARIVDGLRCPYRLHQEDFAQALGISAVDKYETENRQYLRRIFEQIRNFSANPIEDQMRLWDILVFDYLIGNTDNHIKNLSLVYSENLKTMRLAPAYDIISTCVYDGNSSDMAIMIGGKTNIKTINRDDFKVAAEEAGIGQRLAMKHFDEMTKHFEAALKESAKRLTDDGFSGATTFSERILNRGGYRNL